VSCETKRTHLRQSC